MKTTKFDTPVIMQKWGNLFPDHLTNEEIARCQARIIVENAEFNNLFGNTCCSSVHRIDGGNWAILTTFKTANSPNEMVICNVERIGFENSDQLLAEAIYQVQGWSVGQAASSDSVTISGAHQVAFYLNGILSAGGTAFMECKASERVSRSFIDVMVKSIEKIFFGNSTSANEIVALARYYTRINARVA